MPIAIDVNSVFAFAGPAIPECILRWALLIIEDASNACNMSFRVTLDETHLDRMLFVLSSLDPIPDGATFMSEVAATRGFQLLDQGYSILPRYFTEHQFSLLFYANISWRALATSSELKTFAHTSLAAELKAQETSRLSEIETALQTIPEKNLLAEALARTLSVKEHEALIGSLDLCKRILRVCANNHGRVIFNAGVEQQAECIDALRLLDEIGIKVAPSLDVADILHFVDKTIIIKESEPRFVSTVPIHQDGSRWWERV